MESLSSALFAGRRQIFAPEVNSEGLGTGPLVDLL
jgi:hypothetical protein